MFAPHRVPAFLFLFCALLPISCSLIAAQTPSSISGLIARANSGDDSARHQLYRFLLHADPASPAFHSAFLWLRSLASQDVPGAELILGYLYEQGRGLPRDYSRAADNYLAAALHDNHFAQNNLAFLYQHGLGVPLDLHRAFELYLASAQHNNPYAQCNLASMYYSGSGVTRDYVQAAHWFRSAAQLGDPLAQHDLAIFYSEGIGVPLDYKEAAHWEGLSANQGLPSAASGLGLFYESGKGLPIDYVCAYAWYSRALSTGEQSAAARLKSLSSRMTRKQLNQARAYLASLPSPSPDPASFGQTGTTPF